MISVVRKAREAGAPPVRHGCFRFLSKQNMISVVRKGEKQERSKRSWVQGRALVRGLTGTTASQLSTQNAPVEKQERPHPAWMLPVSLSNQHMISVVRKAQRQAREAVAKQVRKQERPPSGMDASGFSPKYFFSESTPPLLKKKKCTKLFSKSSGVWKSIKNEFCGSCEMKVCGMFLGQRTGRVKHDSFLVLSLISARRAPCLPNLPTPLPAHPAYLTYLRPCQRTLPT